MMRKTRRFTRGGEVSHILNTWEQNKVVCKIIFLLNKKVSFCPSHNYLEWNKTNGSTSCYLLQPMSHHIKGIKRERDGWIKGRMESSWRTGVCPNSDSLLAERGGRDAQLRAQSFPACLVPYIDRLAGIKENMNRDLGFTVIHMDHTKLLSSGLQSYSDLQLQMPQWQLILGPIVPKTMQDMDRGVRQGKKIPPYMVIISFNGNISDL